MWSRCWVLLLVSWRVSSIRVKRIVGGREAELPLSPVLVPPLPKEFHPPDQLPTPVTAPPPSTPPPQGISFNGIEKTGMKAFLGLRYGQPPTGENRFQRPRQVIMTGETDARRYGPPCPQLDPTTKEVIGEEDCLFLNVYKPKDAGREAKLPVLFWIHGGNDLRTGSAAVYDPTTLVTTKNIIVVTCNYRLGSLGFLSFGQEDLPGNAGLFDIALALRWVSKYIAYLGGDPKKISVGGQGNGAVLASYQALNKDTRVLINGVVAMSGTPLSPFSVDKHEKETYDQVISESGSTCQQGQTMEERYKFKKCMQELPLASILNGDFKTSEMKTESGTLMNGLIGLNGPGPTEEKMNDDRFLGSFLQGSPLNNLKNAKFPRNIPLLTGVTKEETGGIITGPHFEKLRSLPKFGGELLRDNLFSEIYGANTGLFADKNPDSQLLQFFSNINFINAIKQLVGRALSPIQKIIKYTTTAFYNLPAFVTANIWSGKSNTYLYSFEHDSDHSAGSLFLTGSPLSGTNNENNAPQHGDDLRYIFRPQTLFGDPIEDEMYGNDCEVSNYMMNMLSTFIRDGKPQIKKGVPWSPYSANDNNYMVINLNPHEKKNFHECDMALWTCDVNIMKSARCMTGLDNVIKTAEQIVPMGKNVLLQPADQVTELLNVPSSLGTLVNSKDPISAVTSIFSRPTPKPASNPISDLTKLNPFKNIF